MRISASGRSQELSANIRRADLKLVFLCFAGAFSFLSCSNQPAPLSVKLEHPETGHSLTCAAKDQLGRTDNSMLARTVESCARALEQRGYVRQR